MTWRILHLEDNQIDSEFVKGLLAAEGLDCSIALVATRQEFEAALEENPPDLIISDFSIPSYDGKTALLLARTKCPDVPYIFFSGTLGEEAAVEALKEGATDYVVKHRPAKLIPAIRRALNEAWERAERKRTEKDLAKIEDQLRQAQKLEGIGQLAGGIAHDFNNLLTVINGYGELTLSALPSDHAVRAFVEQITEAGKRAAALTQQILAFSRKQTLRPVVFNVNVGVEKMGGLLRRLIGEHIALVTTTDPAPGYVKADQGQIEQVVMNLAVNARDAMPNGGTVAITTENVEVDEAFARIHMLPVSGAYVRLTVRDMGCGMDADTQARIFEPFFTTKGPDKGTGLGLATVYGIVKQSGGAIVVNSEVGKGSTFSVYLPRVKEDEEWSSEHRPHVNPRQGTETILLLEDEAIVRTLVAQILRGEGYTILEARHGEEAQKICEEHAQPIHLLMTDIVMPGRNGREVAALLRARRPDMKVIFLSGYAEQQETLAQVPDSLLIQKPFAYTSLVTTVRHVLDRPNDGD